MNECYGMGIGTQDGSGMGQGMGQGMGRGRGTNDDVQVSAVLEKLAMLEDTLVTKLEGLIGIVDATVNRDVAEINRKLFDGITKKELVEGILDGDMLSLDGLTARKDVQDALQATKEVHAEAFQTAVGIGGKIQRAEAVIMDETHGIALDVIIHGCTDNIKNRLNVVELKIVSHFDELVEQA